MPADIPASPACIARFGDLCFAPRFEHGDMTEVVEVCGSGDGPELSTGFARFRDADVPTNWAAETA